VFFITTLLKVGGENVVSPKNSSLAFDEALKEFDVKPFNNGFEPEFKVIVNAHYLKSSFAQMTSDDVIQVNGRITVSF
jgi:hypothetical protein